ncbi:class I SAM-dependent methyltransferase [Zooshikella harenae]|uniref:Methyltransferase domain-containing protein n=1 Tax=Zooshikella harenae TaxID=2827238 RepID=A0ABS5ZIK3_9GAMM|nr:class I SAM-dependent methyltransferase [Zooshikella harenae]MBU2713904.1 methyltransferase domain-containing protein [Zooshikella harenae]
MNPKEIATQLRCPSGQKASEVAQQMNKANHQTNDKCINLLHITDNDHVLEIGPGNGAFAQQIIKSATNVVYKGLDWSSHMVKEARKLNKQFIPSKIVSFHQGSSDAIPFSSSFFNKVLSIHTLYFWDSPSLHFAEIHRVMNKDGLFCIAFGDKSFMKDLPFSPFGFTLYHSKKVEQLLVATGFHIQEIQQHFETGLSNTGDTIEKLINIILCRV